MRNWISDQSWITLHALERGEARTVLELLDAYLDFSNLDYKVEANKCHQGLVDWTLARLEAIYPTRGKPGC